MRFTRGLADVFGDQLEQDRIRRALIAARPALAERVHADGERPLLRIPRRRGTDVLVAKISEGPMGAQWIVGVSGSPAPTLHETGTCEEIVRLVLAAVDGAEAADETDPADPAAAADGVRTEPRDER